MEEENKPAPGKGEGKTESEPDTPEKAPKEPEETPKLPVGKSGEKAKEPAASEEGGEKPARPAPARPAAAGPRKPPPGRSRGPSYEDLEDDELLEKLRERFGAERIEGQSFLEQPIYTIDFAVIYDAMLFLRDLPGREFSYLVDLTALDYLGEGKRFCLVYHLYCPASQELIRVKTRLLEDEVSPSVFSIWKTADWMEREIYDMYGIEFSGHPDLKRILLPEDWHGFPLRKDYDIKLQDQAWIRKHLRIRKVPN